MAIPFTTARKYPPSALEGKLPTADRLAQEAVTSIYEELAQADTRECERIARRLEAIAVRASDRARAAMSMAELRQGSLGPKYADTLREQIDAINAVEEARKQAGC